MRKLLLVILFMLTGTSFYAYTGGDWFLFLGGRDLLWFSDDTQADMQKYVNTLK